MVCFIIKIMLDMEIVVVAALFIYLFIYISEVFIFDDVLYKQGFQILLGH